MRWLPRFRFSLRTLLLAVLLIGSGTTLWWNWEPWVLERRIASRHAQVSFSPDGKFLLGTGHGLIMDVWNVETGEQLVKDAPSTPLKFCSTSQYAFSISLE